MASGQDLRAAALALPEAVETPHFGAPSFRVEGKIFAQIGQGESELAILRLPKPRQELLCEARPTAFRPAVWGKSVSCYVVLPEVDATELAELVEASWRNIAPKRLTGRTGPA